MPSFTPSFRLEAECKSLGFLAREADGANLNPFQLARPDLRNLTLGVWLCSFPITGAFVTAAMLRIWKEWFMSWNWERLMMNCVTWYAFWRSLANFLPFAGYVG